MKKEKAFFKNRNFKVAGILFFPDDFDPSKKYPALVATHPGGGVKEQVSSLYGGKLADRGYVVLAFDASHQGESGGEPRFLEDPFARVEDIRCAIDFLVTLPYVDEERIGAFGVCAGGGYSVSAAQTEHRIKAVAGISAWDVGDSSRNGVGRIFTEEDTQSFSTKWRGNARAKPAENPLCTSATFRTARTNLRTKPPQYKGRLASITGLRAPPIPTLQIKCSLPAGESSPLSTRSRTRISYLRARCC